VVTASFAESLPVRRQRTSSQFQDAVRAAVEQIRAGEAFQIVVSQRFEVDTTADALDVYRVLRLTNPSPYMYLLRLDGFDIVGSSPEALVTVKDGIAITHPIAGSKPRGANPTEDAALEAELVADPKERAEHVMLVDLGRNDLGRVCQPGTVEVVEFMEVRRYSHIMHLESTVQGVIDPDRSALDVVPRRVPGRHVVRCAEGPGDGDHRRAGGISAGALRRGRRLPRLRRRRHAAIAIRTARCCATASPTSRPVAASSPTRTRLRRIRSRRTRPRQSYGRSRSPRRFSRWLTPSRGQRGGRPPE
jgi:hypothetical protein